MKFPTLSPAIMVGLCTSMLFLSACGEGDDSSSSGDVVKIGLVLPLSGPTASLGQEQRAGFEYVVEEINSGGGIKSLDGAKIEVVTADDASDPRVTVDETRRLITQEEVQMIAGLSSSNQVVATAPLLQQQKVPGLSMTSQTSGPGEYVFTIGVTAAGMAETKVAFLNYLRDEKDVDVERVAIAYADYEAGQSVRDEEKALLEADGYDVVGEVALGVDTTDVTPAIIQLRSMKPDAILSTALNATGIRLHEARAAQRYDDPIWIGNFGGWAERAVWDAVGEDVARETMANQTFVMNYYDSSVDIGPARELVDTAQAAGVESVFGGHFIMGAQAARVVEAALEESGSSGEITPGAIREALFDISLTADSGKVYLPRDELKFTEDRVFDDQTGVVLQWTEDGKQEPLWPEEFKLAEPRL